MKLFYFDFFTIALWLATVVTKYFLDLKNGISVVMQEVHRDFQSAIGLMIEKRNECKSLKNAYVVKLYLYESL